jgi:hypothetical protein
MTLHKGGIFPQHPEFVISSKRAEVIRHVKLNPIADGH